MSSVRRFLRGPGLIWAMVLTATAGWSLATISARKVYSAGQVFTAADYNADVNYWVTYINQLMTKFPGDSVKTMFGSFDTLTTQTSGGVITLKDPIWSLSASDSLKFHLINARRANLDTLGVGATGASGAGVPVGFRVAFTAGIRARANLLSADSLRIVDSLDVSAGAKVYSRANIKTDSLSVGSGPIVGFRVAFTAGIRGRANLLSVDSLRIVDSLVFAGGAKIGMLGSSSGLLTLLPAAATTSYTLTLPATGGTTAYPLTTNGSGTTTFSLLTVPGGGTGVATLASNGVLYGNGAGAVQVTTQGAANSVLAANAGAPAFSASPTIGTSVTTPVVIGGTAAGSTLTLKTTSGNGTADSVLIVGGNNGASNIGRIFPGGLHLNNTGGVPIARIRGWNGGGAGGRLYFENSRNATVGAHTIVQSGDQLGTVTFYGSDGTDFRGAAQIVVNVDATPGANDMPGNMILYTTPDASATMAPRLEIDNAGLVTIDVDGTMNAGTHHFQINNGGSTSYIDAGSTAFTSSDSTKKDHIVNLDTAAIYNAYLSMPLPRQWRFRKDFFFRPEDLQAIKDRPGITPEQIGADSARADARAAASAAEVHVGPMAQEMYPLAQIFRGVQADSAVVNMGDLTIAQDFMIRRLVAQVAALTARVDSLEAWKAGR